MFSSVHRIGHAHGGDDEGSDGRVVRPRFKVDEVDVVSIGPEPITGAYRIPADDGDRDVALEQGFHGFSAHVTRAEHDTARKPAFGHHRVE